MTDILSELKAAADRKWRGDPACQQAGLFARAAAEIERLRDTLAYAEVALADIGDADREPGDDLAWCESRAAEALPRVRAQLGALGPNVALSGARDHVDGA